STSATSAARRSPSDSVADPDIEAGTYPVVTRLQAPPFDVLAPYLPTRGAAADPETATAVRAIIEDVRARGGAAAVDHARRLDGPSWRVCRRSSWSPRRRANRTWCSRRPGSPE